MIGKMNVQQILFTIQDVTPITVRRKGMIGYLTRQVSPFGLS
jgi:hypothetical protein